MPIATNDFNGLGKRVTNNSISLGKHASKIERNEEDIQKILVGMTRLPFWIIGSMLIPSILILYQIAMK